RPGACFNPGSATTYTTHKTRSRGSPLAAPSFRSKESRSSRSSPSSLLRGTNPFQLRQSSRLACQPAANRTRWLPCTRFTFQLSLLLAALWGTGSGGVML
uniref:Uncharacterized protein n=1 Tax=Aegilops tauschii subsp. strangulata TaxID=200361 RepID=A0A453LQ94_AEGTS